jgi:hypothetical protein
MKRYLILGLLGLIAQSVPARSDDYKKTESASSDNAADGEQYALTVSLPKKTFHEGQPIELSLEFKNKRSDSVTIWNSGFWPNHRIDVRGPGEKAPEMTKEGKVRHDAFSPAGPRDKNVPKVLKRGEIYKYGQSVDLANLYRLTPGRYSVKVTYDDRQPPTPLRVNSPTISFEVK